MNQSPTMPSSSSSSPSPALSAPLSTPMPSSSSSSPSPALSAPPSTPTDNPAMDSVPGERPMIERPEGAYFLPRDEHMTSLLSKKVSGQPLHHCDVRGMHLPRDVDVSQFQPEDLPRNDDDLDRHLSVFFTTRTNDVPGGGRPSRPTPRGCWKGTHKGDRRIGGRHRGRAVGFKRMFIYYQGKAPNEVKTVWMMKEVRLNPRCQQHQNLDPQKMQSCVICKVYNYLDEDTDSEDHHHHHHHHQSLIPINWGRLHESCSAKDFYQV